MSGVTCRETKSSLAMPAQLEDLMLPWAHTNTSLDVDSSAGLPGLAYKMPPLAMVMAGEEGAVVMVATEKLERWRRDISTC